MNNQEEQVLSAFKLWKDNIISISIFHEALDKIKNSLNGLNSPNPVEITQGQINYIKRLQHEGKIPLTQSLNLTKLEAQSLIHNIVSPPKIDKIPIKTPIQDEKVTAQIEELYEDNVVW
jgi:hypothetical protein